MPVTAVCLYAQKVCAIVCMSSHICNCMYTLDLSVYHKPREKTMSSAVIFKGKLFILLISDILNSLEKFYLPPKTKSPDLRIFVVSCYKANI